MPVKSESQLELFKGEAPSARPPHRETLGRFLVQARYDQLVLVGIAGLIGVTVVFASGVERGKQLARTERALLTREPRIPTSPRSNLLERGSHTGLPVVRGEPPTASTTSVVGTEPSVASQVVPKGGKSAGGAVPSLTPPAPKRKPPSKPALAKSRYAVQVVTYSRPLLAKQELQRLQAKGEPAFLVMREGRTSVYVGPFPTKGNAQEKVARLKARYQDCFVKSLSQDG